MTAIGCGFFSYNVELVYMTFNLFTQLFDKLQQDAGMNGSQESPVLEQALKWFLSQSPAQDASNSADMTVAALLADDK